MISTFCGYYRRVVSWQLSDWSVLNASSSAREAMIEDPLVLFQRCCSKRLHHPLIESNHTLSPIMKYGMGRSSPGRGSCCGILIELVMTASRNVDSFHSWASDAMFMLDWLSLSISSLFSLFMAVKLITDLMPTLYNTTIVL